MSNLLTVTKTKTKQNNTTMSEEVKSTENIDAVLSSPFVQELLTFVSALRSALGDEKGELENSELVARAKDAYKG